MAPQLTLADSLTKQIATALAAASDKWKGCDWPTEFGRSHLNLNGLRPSQALLMARATAGREASDWCDAVTWLRRVEQDARQAESEAQTAATLALSGKLRDALQFANRACALEARYRKPKKWQPLRDAIEGALVTVDNNKPDEPQIDV